MGRAQRKQWNGLFYIMYIYISKYKMTLQESPNHPFFGSDTSLMRLWDLAWAQCETIYVEVVL